MASGWAPPEVGQPSAGWSPPEVGGSQTPAADESAAEGNPSDPYAGASTGASEGMASQATGALASVPAGVDFLARSAIHGTGALIGYSLAGDDPQKRQQITDWLTKKHQEDRDAFDDIQSFWSYSPKTKEGEAANEAAAAPVRAAGAATSAVLPDNAAQTVKDVTGDVARAAAGVPALGEIPKIPGAVASARAAKTASEAADAAAAAKAAEPKVAPKAAVTADQLTSAPNPIPKPNEEAPTSQATLAVQKPKITPRAGESATDAAKRQGLLPAASQEAPGTANATPPATPAARMFHPPQEDGPQYATKAAPADQAARQSTLGDLNQLGGGVMKADRRGAVTGDWDETGNEHQTKLIPDAPGQLLRDQIGSEHQALHNATQSTADSVGSVARNDIDRDTLEQRGQIVRGAVQGIEQHLNNAANGMYSTARAVLGDRPMTSMPRVQQILSDSSHDVNPTAASLRRAASAKMDQLWSVGDTRGSVKTAPGTVGAAERFHEFLNDSYHNDSAGLIRKLKNATDLDVAERAGGNDMYQSARNVIRHRETMLEPDGVNALRAPKDRNKIDNDVPLHEVMDHVTNLDSEHFEHFMNVLRAGAHLSPELAEKSAAAIREIQGHMIAKLHTAARGEGGAWNASNFYKAANRFSTNMPQAFKHNPEVLANLQTINRAGNILKMDKSYPGAVSQAAKVGLLPQLAQKAIKGAKSIGEVGGLAHGNIPLTVGAHFGGKALEAGVNKLAAGSRMRAAQASLLGHRVPGQGGWIGDLQRDKLPEITDHQHDPETGEHLVKTANGFTSATDDGRDIRVHLTNTNEAPASGVAARGKGESTSRLAYLADIAHDRGGVLHSDKTVSALQQKAYSAVHGLGYDVSKKPGTELNESTGGLMHMEGPLTVGPRPGTKATYGISDEARESQGEVDAMRRMASSKFGDKQRGSVSILNVGHDVDGGKSLSKADVAREVAKVGGKITSHDVIKPSDKSPNLTEPTSVVALKKALTEPQGQALAKALNQKAISQKTGDYDQGNMFVQPQHAAAAAEQGWDKFNPEYFHHADGQTEAQHAASFNTDKMDVHPNSTVTNAERSAYPGIYDAPKDIMSRVKTAPEDPVMKELFGATRKDLHDIAVSRGDVAPTSIPGVKEGGKAAGSKAAKNVTNDANAERIRNTISAFKDHDESAYHGMVGWYVMDHLHQAVQKVLGKGKAADAAYSRLNTLMGMASPGSDVNTEINRGTAANMMASQGKFDQFEKYAGKPAGSKGKPDELANVSGHPYHSTAQAIPMRRYLEGGGGAQAPKTSMYIAASENPKSPGFQNKVLVGDSHFARGVGLSDARTAKDFHGSISGPELADVHPWYHENVAKPSGLPSTSAQAVQWGALSHETGVDTAIGAPKLELFAQQVAVAAKRMGVSNKEALTRIIKGIAHAG